MKLSQELFSHIFWPWFLIDNFRDENAIHEIDQTFKFIFAQVFDKNFLLHVNLSNVVLAEVANKHNLSVILFVNNIRCKIDFIVIDPNE